MATAIVAAAIALAGCGGDGGGGDDAPALNDPCVSWCGTIAPWPHDGNPYQTYYSTVYGDGSSLESKALVAQIAEELLAELRTLLELAPLEQYLLRLGRSKLHFYVYRYHNPQEWGGNAWLGGFMVYAVDHPGRSSAGLTEIGKYTRLIKHEVTHVAQNLIVGSSHSFSTHTWFEEGFAELLSELNPEFRIETAQDFENRITAYGALNPIAIENDVYPDIPEVASRYYYPMFELTMRYLLDPRGLGRSPLDVKRVFEDMAGGASFVNAFASRFGVTVVTLRAEFFTRLRDYLAAAAVPHS